jgi:hypothetical protein
VNTFLGVLGGFLSGSSRGRDSELSKEELIQAFRTITTMINILQPSLDSASDSPEDAQQAPLTRSEARALRILTALAIAIVRKKEVTAVVVSHPQRPSGDGRVHVIATSQPNAHPHHFFALRNPHTTHPKLGGSSEYELLTPPPNLKIDLSTPLTDLDPS